MENRKDNANNALNETTPKKKKKSGKVGLALIISILAVIVVLAGGGFAYLSYINNTPLPQIDGQIEAHGLQAKVDVIRDSYGVPHIYGQTLHDVIFAQGYLQAQDRWWQMEFFRHTCAGRIEELTGKKASLISADIYLRTMGWYDVADKEYNSYTPAQRAILDSSRKVSMPTFPTGAHRNFR